MLCMTPTSGRGGAQAADHPAGRHATVQAQRARGLLPRLPPLALLWSSSEADGRQMGWRLCQRWLGEEMTEHATAASRRQCCRRECWLAGAAAATVGGGRPRSIHHNSLHTTNLMHNLVAAAGAWLQLWDGSPDSGIVSLFISHIQ